MTRTAVSAGLGRVLLDAVLLAVFGGMVWAARDWPSLVQVIPMTVGGIGLFLVALLLLQDAARVRRGAAGDPEPVPATGPSYGVDVAVDGEEEVPLPDVLRATAALLMFLVAGMLFGFALGGALGAVVYLRFLQKQSILRSTLVAVVLYVVVRYLFQDLLQVSLPVPMIFG